MATTNETTGTDQPPPYPGDDQVCYPGRMVTYPGYTRGQPPLFVHDCVQGCPGMPLRPGQHGYVAPPKGYEAPPIQIPPPAGLSLPVLLNHREWTADLYLML